MDLDAAVEDDHERVGVDLADDVGKKDEVGRADDEEDEVSPAVFKKRDIGCLPVGCGADGLEGSSSPEDRDSSSSEDDSESSAVLKKRDMDKDETKM